MIQLWLDNTILIFLFTLSPPIGNQTRTSSMESVSPRFEGHHYNNKSISHLPRLDHRNTSTGNNISALNSYTHNRARLDSQDSLGQNAVRTGNAVGRQCLDSQDFIHW